MSRLPDFIIAGMGRSGTTWLRYVLSDHPQIYIPPYHINYFCGSKGYAANKVKTLKEYKKCFELAELSQVVGDDSPAELPFDWYGRNHLIKIKRIIPNIKFVIVLRNPVDWVQAQVRQYMRVSLDNKVSITVLPKDKLSLIDLDLDNFESNFVTNGKYTKIRGKKHPNYPMSRNYFEITEQAKYVKYLKRLFDEFTAEVVHIIILEEDIIPNPQKVAEDLYAFLGVENPPTFPDFDEHKNINEPIPSSEYSVSNGATEIMSEYFRPYNEKLFELIGRRIPSWE